MLKYVLFVTILVLAMLLMCGCAPGPNSAEDTPSADGHIAGFIFGFWHGLISPITFVLSIFFDSVNIYEVHNNGNWYNFGFVLGAGLFLTGGILGRKKRDR